MTNLVYFRLHHHSCHLCGLYRKEEGAFGGYVEIAEGYSLWKHEHFERGVVVRVVGEVDFEISICDSANRFDANAGIKRLWVGGGVFEWGDAVFFFDTEFVLVVDVLRLRLKLNSCTTKR